MHLWFHVGLLVAVFSTSASLSHESSFENVFRFECAEKADGGLGGESGHKFSTLDPSGGGSGVKFVNPDPSGGEPESM